MIASIVRAVMAVKQPQTIAPILLWSMVEETVTTVVANAPILRVLVFPGRSFGSGYTPGPHSSVGYTRERSKHDNFELVAGKNGVVAEVSSPKEHTNLGCRDNGLVVLRTVEVTVQSGPTDRKDEDESCSESSSWIA